MVRVLIFVLFLLFGFSSTSYAGMEKAIDTVKTGAMVTMGLNTATGKKYLNICQKSSPYGMWACVVAGTAFVQAGSDAKTSSDARTQGEKVDGGLADFGDPNSNNPSNNDPETDRYIKDAEKGIKKLKDMGVRFSKDGTVTGPDGASASASDLNSGKALADKGLIDAADILKYDKAVAEMKKKNKFTIKAQNARGGYKGKRRGTASDDSYASGYSFGMDQSQIKAAQTSGLTKDFGGTPIGVASDDLFNMITTRYDSLKEQRQFIDNSAGSYPGQR